MTAGEENNFRYVVMAARRARQLQNGSQPLIDTRSSKACRVAQDEINAGKVKAAEQPLPALTPDFDDRVGVALDLPRPRDIDS
jgi:DNA-directed RNA polymerase subunit omega